MNSTTLTQAFALPRRLSVAPMLDWSDRHYRYLARLISRQTWLYSEMVTTGALLFGSAERHLHFDLAERPLALQLGGSEPDDLARCAKLAEQWGYDEVNLNCGCPSERVQRGAFGACLMAEPALVNDCLSAMRDACNITVTVKHRIGINDVEDYDYVRRFVDQLRPSGCATFIVHARNAWLKGLSPKENREIPPLKYDYVYRLKRELPELQIIINGGITSHEQVDEHLRHVDGVMVGREAYHNPYFLAGVDQRYYGDTGAQLDRDAVVDAMLPYIERELSAGRGTTLRHIARHMLGLYQGLPGARQWRRMLSDAALLKDAGPELVLQARKAVKSAAGAMRD